MKGKRIRLTSIPTNVPVFVVQEDEFIWSLSPVLPYGSEAFNDRAKLATEYLYDKNGNTTYDANGGISTIGYNLLNLPEIVQFSQGHQNRYSYSAGGKKLTNNSYILLPERPPGEYPRRNQQQRHTD